MAKNTGHNVQQPEEEEEVSGEGFEEVAAKLGNISYSFRIQELLSKCDISETPTFTLYKFDNPLNAEDKSFIERYVRDDPPSEDEIGRSFGSGRYMMNMAVPYKGQSNGSLCRVYKFRINARYDKIANPSPAGPSGMIQQSPVVVKDTSGIQVIEMMERLFRSLAPMFIRPNDPDMKALIFQNYKDTAEVLKKQQLSTIRAYQEQLAAGEEMPTATEEKEVSIIEQFAPLLQQFLPLLLGGGKKAEAVATVARATPQFAAIVKDRGKFRRLLTHLDTTEGKEKTDKILSVLKLKR